jgi:hypothetical protein
VAKGRERFRFTTGRPQRYISIYMYREVPAEEAIFDPWFASVTPENRPKQETIYSVVYWFKIFSLATCCIDCGVAYGFVMSSYMQLYSYCKLWLLDPFILFIFNKHYFFFYIYPKSYSVIAGAWSLTDRTNICFFPVEFPCMTHEAFCNNLSRNSFSLKTRFAVKWFLKIERAYED